MFSKYDYISLNKLYTGITTSALLELPVCVWFTLLLQLVNGTEFLNITFFIGNITGSLH